MDEGTSSEARAGGTSRKKWLLLAAAAVAAAGAIGWRALSDDGPEPVAASAPGDVAPLTIDELEARAETDPKDADAWQELGYAYYAQGDYAAAAKAYRQAVEGAPDAAVLWGALGEARILASKDDPMPPLAVAALEKALELDPKEPRARYYLAARRDIAGDHEGAIAEWLALLADTPAGSMQEENLVKTIEQVGKINDIPVAERIARASEGRPAAAPELTAGQAIPGPSKQQIAAASSIPPSQQQQMAEGMVERLETRLKGSPENVDGWVMLMRSRVTLGQPERAKKALADAIAANPAAADRLRKEAAALGVT